MGTVILVNPELNVGIWYANTIRNKELRRSVILGHEKSSGGGAKEKRGYRATPATL